MPFYKLYPHIPASQLYFAVSYKNNNIFEVTDTKMDNPGIT